MDDSEEVGSEPVYWSEQETVETALRALDSLPVARSIQVVKAWLAAAISDADVEAPPGLYEAALCCQRALLNQTQPEESARIASGAAQLALGAQVDTRPLEPDSLSRNARLLARLVEQVDAEPWIAGPATKASTLDGGAVPHATRHERDARKLARWLEPHLGRVLTDAATVNQVSKALAKRRTAGKNKGNARLRAIAKAVGLEVSDTTMRKAFRPSRRK